MKKLLTILMVMVIALIVGVGCDKKEAATNITPKVKSPDTKAIALCAMCGEVKGSEKCCKPDAVKCDMCGLAKGSPACCKGIDFSKGDVKLCSMCGEVKGSEKCCNPDAEKCEKCGMAKGSPGCCIK